MKDLQDIALFDLDSTLCDYSKSMAKEYNEILSPGEEPFKDFRKNLPSYIENRIRLIRNQPGWWRNMEKFQLGFDILEIAKKLDYDIFILTKAPKRHKNAWTEKVEWCKIHVPEAQITITDKKGLIYGKVLVDDYPPYIEEWLEHRPRGLVILPAQTWNKDFSHPNVIRYDGTNLDLVKKAMEIAKKRKPEEILNLSKI